MASVSKDGSGWRVLFVCPATGKRHTVRNGRCAKKNAETARNMIEKLIEARRLGSAVGGQTAEWLKAIDDRLRGRLARVSLIDLPGATLLGPFLAGYMGQRQERGNVTPATIEVWGRTRRNLETFFGADKDMRAVTPADADAWAAWLRADETLAENTIRKRCQFAKMFFSVAVKRKLIAENPFSGLVGTVVSVPERQHFLPRETVDLLLDQCYTAEYRLLLIVARYRGVRVPSEIVPLTWQDMDWQAQRIVITSPKTKRQAGLSHLPRSAAHAPRGLRRGARGGGLGVPLDPHRGQEPPHVAGAGHRGDHGQPSGAVREPGTETGTVPARIGPYRAGRACWRPRKNGVLQGLAV